MAYKLKIILAGPSRSGKTLLANFLADATEAPLDDYRPTHVIRVLEFETNVNVKGRSTKTDIELWDSSGNPSFKDCWPAVAWEAHGVIFVFNPEEDQQARDLELYFDHFCGQLSVQGSIPENQTIIFSSVKGRGTRRPKLHSKFSRIPQIEVNVENDGKRVRAEFDSFLTSIVENLTARHEQEEINIMNMRS